MTDLSKRQRQILQFIQEMVQAKGYPPSVREIGEAVGLMSSSTVHGHLRKLEIHGFIRRDPSKPRAIEVLGTEGTGVQKSIRNVPIVGAVTAGEPILAVENIEDYFPIPREFSDWETVFMLRVRGESMIEAGILDGDHVLVEQKNTARDGDIVVALVNGDEATVKHFYQDGNVVRLQPANAALDPVYPNDVTILGQVVGVFRKIS